MTGKESDTSKAGFPTPNKKRKNKFKSLFKKARWFLLLLVPMKLPETILLERNALQLALIEWKNYKGPGKAVENPARIAFAMSGSKALSTQTRLPQYFNRGNKDLIPGTEKQTAKAQLMVLDIDESIVLFQKRW